MSFLDDPISEIGDLGSELVDTLAGDLLTAFGLSTLKQLNEQGESDFKQWNTNEIDIRQWFGPTDTLQPPFILMLKGQVKGISKIVRFPFLISPQSEQITEPAATTIQYTQGGGKITQSEGGISKEIVVSGTFGLYPNQNSPRRPSSGIRSGFEAINTLKMVFRRYLFLKRYGDLTKTIQLIYITRRRQEAWVVEPKSLVIDDAADHNFHSRYTITMEALYPYDGAEVKGLMERLLDAVPGYEEFNWITQTLCEAVDGLNAFTGQISSLINNFFVVGYTPLVNLANACADLATGRLPNLQSFKRDSLKGLAQIFRDMGFALERAGLKEAAFFCFLANKGINKVLLKNDLFQRKPNTRAQQLERLAEKTVDSFRTPQGIAVARDEANRVGAANATPDAGQLLGGTKKTPTALLGSQTLASQEAKKALTKQSAARSPGSETISTTSSNAYSKNVPQVLDPNQLVPPSTADLTSNAAWRSAMETYLANINPANSDFTTATVAIGDDISALAYKLTGDHARWPELVLLNNLEYPYVASRAHIDANGLKNVLAYGEQILYAIPKRKNLGSDRRLFRNETEFSLQLSPFERALGNDILIDEKTGDVVWGANDLELTYGVDNIKQFIRKRVTLKKGTLRRALSLGLSDYIGVSDTEGLEAIITAEAEALVADDDRISAIRVLEVKKNAQALQLTLAAFVKDIQDPIIIPVEI